MKLYSPTVARFAAIALLCTSGAAWSADQANETTADNAAANTKEQQTQDQATDSPSTGEQAATIKGTVARATFSSAIEDREPVDKLTEASNNKIYYFTELRDMAGQQVTHRWEHNGKVMAEVPFEIRGDRWRVYSSKRIQPEWKGEWKASVIGSDGSELAANTITLDNIQPEQAPAADTAAPADTIDAAPATTTETPADATAQ